MGLTAEPMIVEIRNLQDISADLSQLEQVVQAAAERMAEALDNLSIVLVDDERMAALNQRLLGRSGPTDVIAFQAEEDEEGQGGEIIISVEAAARQAQEYGHSLERELCLLAVHGLLHVLGYEDEPETKRAEMERIQQQLMTEIWPP